MSAIGLGSRAIIGEFYKTLEQHVGGDWINAITMLFTSDQDSETYKWLGQTPAMREWVGGRNAKGFSENGLTITNKHYEGTVEYLVRELRRDKTGQLLIRIQELADRTNSHWMTLVSTLISNGTSSVCYDGQFFYDTDHTEGNNTTNQSNDLTIDISAEPAQVAGTPTAPSVEEAQHTVMKAIAAILGFKDNENEPMNEGAQEFVVMTSTALYLYFSQAFNSAAPANGVAAQLVPSNLKVSVVMNPRLTDTDAIHVFRADGRVSPFIRQQETDVQLKSKAEGSEFEFDNDAHQHGVDTWRNVGYGYWQHACYIQMT